MIAVLGWALVLGWLAISGLGLLAALRWRAGLRARPGGPGRRARVLILLPVRAETPEAAARLRACLAALTRQRFPGRWRAVVAFEDARDLGVAEARAAGERVSVVFAGRSTGESQKVANLRAALARRRPKDEILVTLDADVAAQEDWLETLTRPLREGRAEAASGYRWMLPEGPLARLAALADRAPATLARPRRCNLAWGGSTALSMGLVDRIGLDGVWAGQVSDDLALTRALHAAGAAPWTPLRALSPSPCRHDLRSLIEFARRQHLLLRVHATRFWALLGATLVVPAAGAAWAAVAAWQGEVWGWAALGAGLALQQAKVTVRGEVGAEVLTPEDAARLRAQRRLDRVLAPIADGLHLLLFLGSLFGRSFAWGDRIYRWDGSRWSDRPRPKRQV